jgi:excisionase family DNA binding protein
MYTVTDLAERYGVSRLTVITWIEAGELAALDVSPRRKRRRFRVTEAALTEFELVRSTKPALKPANFRKVCSFV